MKKVYLSLVTIVSIGVCNQITGAQEVISKLGKNGGGWNY
jgi:hypothetical protein